MSAEHITSHNFDLSSRETFTNALFQQGCISQAFVESGLIDRFEHDEALGRDAAKHILIGDELGGFHHLKTSMDLGVENNSASSLLVRPSDYGEGGSQKLRKPAESRRKQRVAENGTFRSELVEIAGHTKRTLEGEDELATSAMFPSEWTAEDVLCCVVAASEHGTFVDADKKRQTVRLEYTDEPSNVTLQVVVRTATGKIATAYPVRPRAPQHSSQPTH